jgi:zinc/manganese transport system substrate-binding protein
MKSIALYKLAALAFAATTVTAVPVAKKLNVVATTPDLGAVASAIGGDLINLKVMAKPTEDPHFVDAKPSNIILLNRADVLIEGGAELELGWLPALMESARNNKIAGGAPGHVAASQGIHLVEVPTSFDRSKGDIHSMGNPHFMIDPLNARIVAGNIANHLAQVDPANAAKYRANLAAFQSRIDSKMSEWTKKLAPYAGSKIVTYHKDFPYLAERFKLDVIDNLEPKPGIAPSPAHLAQVITAMKSQNAHVIIVQPFQNRKTAETVARQTGGRVVDLSQQPGAVEGTTTYFDLIDHVVDSLVTAFQGK